MTRTVLITGANRGIGLAFCKHYLQEGSMVYATCRKPKHTAELHELQSDHKEKLQLLELDVCSPDSLFQLKDSLNNISLDLLINNAGIMGSRGGFGSFLTALEDAAGLQEITQSWLSVFHTNTIGPIMLSLVLLPNLELGNEKKVVMISSQMGSIANHAADAITSASLYRTSKSALNSAAVSLSVALKPKNIGVILLHPGWVKTDMGGDQADIDVHTSVSGMVKVIAASDGLKPLQLVDYQGKVVPW